MYNKTDYIKQQTDTKKRLHQLYTDFMTQKQLKDIMTILCNYKTVHHYSINNIILCYIQAIDREDKKYTGILNSYLNWQKQDIQVLRGSQGFKILVPAFKKLTEKKNNGNGDITDVERIIKHFKIGNTFDISQTSAYDTYLKDMKEKDKTVYANYTIDFDKVISIVRKHFTGNIIEDYNNGECKGSYCPVSGSITLHDKTAHTLLHEYGHHIAISVLKIDDRNQYAKGEIIAELFTYMSMNAIDSNVTYNFAYSNIWANRLNNEYFTLTDFTKCYKSIEEYIDKLKIV